MGFEVNRQRESVKPRLKLSKTGKYIVAAGVLAVAAVVVIILVSLSASKEENVYKSAIEGAVNRSVTVCRNSAAELGLGVSDSAKTEEYIQAVQNEKKLYKRSELALEMITYILGLSGSNTAVQDDLKGAQNRIFTAVNEYKARYGGKSF